MRSGREREGGFTREAHIREHACTRAAGQSLRGCSVRHLVVVVVVVVVVERGGVETVSSVEAAAL